MNIFSYQQKRQLVDRFIQYTEKFKVTATERSNNKLDLSISGKNFTLNRLPTYQVDSKNKLNR